jgi:sugar phosphate isomerase/epimerase
MIDRRGMLAGLSAAVAAIGAGPTLAAPARRPLDIQFFTLNAFANKGWEKFSEGMAAARAIGYDGIEFAGVMGHDPKLIARRAEELGLKLRSYHIGNDIVRAFQAPGPNGGGIAGAQDAAYTPLGIVQICRATAGIARDLGVQYAGLGAVGRSSFKDIDSVKRISHAFNECAEIMAAAGLTFFYHNHAIDFQPINGLVPFDIIMAESSPAVRIQFDTGWAGIEGFDAVPIIQKYASRIDLLHLRDANAQKQAVTPGQGQLDFTAILRASSALKDPVFVVEGGAPTEQAAIAEATKAYEILNRLGLGMKIV